MNPIKELAVGPRLDADPGVTATYPYWQVVDGTRDLRAEFDLQLQALQQQFPDPSSNRYGERYRGLKDDFGRQVKPVLNDLTAEARRYNRGKNEANGSAGLVEQNQQGLDALGFSILLYGAVVSDRSFYNFQFPVIVTGRDSREQAHQVSQNPVQIIIDHGDHQVPIRTNLARLAAQARIAAGREPWDHVAFNSAQVLSHLIPFPNFQQENAKDYLVRKEVELVEAQRVLAQTPEGSVQRPEFAHLVKVLTHSVHGLRNDVVLKGN